jgi:hypothetical protein
MNSSPEIKDLAAAMAKFQAELKPAIKGNTNPYFKSRYADLQACWDCCRDALVKNGLSVVQGSRESNGEIVTVDTRLMHASGQWIESSLTMKPAKADPQGVGSAVTYARRYALSAILGIVADEDDDGNAATHNEPKKALSVAEKATGAAKVEPLISKESESFLKLADPALVDRVMVKFGHIAIGDLTETQAAKGITFIKAEMAKREAAKKPETKTVDAPF